MSRTVTGRWLVGADGANSFVREAGGITRRDLGFQERWLVVDAAPHEMGALAHLPIASQRCDPARPTTIVQSGPRHRRWEFMLLPDEQPADFEDPDRVWALLEPWYRPEDGSLTRSAVYEFRSMLAEQMRKGHVLLVGDAAHLTPPFLGQGLCSGLRDAANVAWKLDLVLRGLASEELLDTVDPERQPQNEAIISWPSSWGRCCASSIRRPPPSATRYCARLARRRRPSSRRSPTARFTVRTTRIRSPESSASRASSRARGGRGGSTTSWVAAFS